MENQEFDQFARESADATTRRTLVRGLAAVFGAAGVGVAVSRDADAGKSKRKKQKQRKKKNEKKKQCGSGDKTCATPLNPCATVECQKGKCVEGSKPDQTACGQDLVCESGACVCPSGVCTVRVTSSNRSNWIGYNDNNNQVDNTLLHFRTGPSDPPYGAGSVELVSPAGERHNVATYQFAGIELSQITSLKFTTYAPTAGNTGGVNSTGYLHFNVDFFGSDTWQRRLVFVPADNGTVTRDVWQEWDAINGGSAKWLWSDFNNPWPGGGTQPNGSVAKTWAQLLSEYPGIRIRPTDGFFGIRDGASHLNANTEDINSVTLGTESGTTRFVFGSTS